MIKIINLRNVLNGLVKRIHETFPDFRIYTESIEQGLSPPCFSVICEQPVSKRFLGNRFYRSFDFCVYYYPKSDDFFDEINEISEILIPRLELIDAGGDLIRSTELSTKTVDDVLVICVSYGCFVYETNEAPRMEKLNYNNKSKF